MKLKRILYGLRESTRNWFNKLCKGLDSLDFKTTDDPCVFMNKKKRMVCITWVDDCLFFAAKAENITFVFLELQKTYDVDREEDVAGFLGLEMRKHKDGSIELLQTGLIDRIIKSLGLEDANPKYTPAEVGLLGKDQDGPPRKESWNYRSAVGMLLYLQSNTRPDITFAVSQVARFANDPKLKHETAVKRIAKYLKATKSKGTIIKPMKNLKLDCYADADFAGLWTLKTHKIQYV